MPVSSDPVLLIDDDASVRRTLARFLGRDGIAVVEAGDGREALTYLRDGGAASVIVLDLRMPVMDGFAFRAEQRREPALADIPVIVLSGADTDRFDEIGAAASFEKPASFASLVECVRELSGRQ